VAEIKIYLRLDGEPAKRYAQVKRYLGLKNDTEIMRSLINWYWRAHRDELQPKLEPYNINEHGMMVLDRDLGQIVQVYFNQDKILCDHCEVSTCKHAEYALSIPKVQEILREKGFSKEAKIEA